MPSSLPIILTYLLSSDPSLPIIHDDSGFVDTYSSWESWKLASPYVGAIEIGFNIARANDPTVTTLMVLPTQEIWDAMNDQEKVLYLLNRERYDRGIKPFEGYHSDVDGVAQNYAQYLLNLGSNTMSHNEDDTPIQRLQRVTNIQNNQDTDLAFPENIYTVNVYGDYVQDYVVKSVYEWMYYDRWSDTAHRKLCLANNLTDNSGVHGQEGLIGIGVSNGTDYYEGDARDTVYSTLVVMNAFDPSENWSHSETKTVSLTPQLNPSSTRYDIDYNNRIINDTQSGLMWLLIPIA